jgi:hypothetical protein
LDAFVDKSLGKIFLTQTAKVYVYSRAANTFDAKRPVFQVSAAFTILMGVISVLALTKNLVEDLPKLWGPNGDYIAFVLSGNQKLRTKNEEIIYRRKHKKTKRGDDKPLKKESTSPKSDSAYGLVMMWAGLSSIVGFQLFVLIGWCLMPAHGNFKVPFKYWAKNEACRWDTAYDEHGVDDFYGLDAEVAQKIEEDCSKSVFPTGLLLLSMFIGISASMSKIDKVFMGFGKPPYLQLIVDSCKDGATESRAYDAIAR